MMVRRKTTKMTKTTTTKTTMTGRGKMMRIRLTSCTNSSSRLDINNSRS